MIKFSLDPAGHPAETTLVIEQDGRPLARVVVFVGFEDLNFVSVDVKPADWRHSSARAQAFMGEQSPEWNEGHPYISGRQELGNFNGALFYNFYVEPSRAAGRERRKYVARCTGTDCGWTGKPQNTRALAERDGDDHTAMAGIATAEHRTTVA